MQSASVAALPQSLTTLELEFDEQYMVGYLVAGGLVGGEMEVVEAEGLGVCDGHGVYDGHSFWPSVQAGHSFWPSVQAGH